jgi:hypothetical protein
MYKYVEDEIQICTQLHLITGKPLNSKFTKGQENLVTINGDGINARCYTFFTIIDA